MYSPAKIDQTQTSDLLWNLPEQPLGKILNLGGSSSSFLATIKNSEFLLQNFRLQALTTLLPDSLKPKLQNVDHLVFAPSTNSGSFAPSKILSSFFSFADCSARSILSTPSSQATKNTNHSASDFDLILLSGEFSKNPATISTLSGLIKNSPLPTVISRDTIDLLSSSPELNLNNSNLILIASIPQLQKTLKTLLYPKMIFFSLPLLQVVDILHKFTITYPLTIMTLHQNQLIFAKSGEVELLELTATNYTPLSLFTTTLPAAIAAFNLYNPHKPLLATAAACLYR